MALVPELLVTDLRSSLVFWRDLIGFQIRYDRPEEGFAYLELGAPHVMLEELRPTSRQWLTGPLERPLGRGINFQIEVTDLDGILARLRDAQWPLYMEPETKTYRVADRESTQRQFLVSKSAPIYSRLHETSVCRQANSRAAVISSSADTGSR